MCKTRPNGDLRLIELTIVPDVWIDGVGKIDKIAADTYRVLLYRTRHPIEGGPDEHEVVISLLASGAMARAALALITRAVMGSAEAFEAVTLMQ